MPTPHVPRPPRRPRPATLAVVAVTAALLVTANSVSYAAGGPSLLLGERNRTSSTTTLANAGSGPALKLRTRAGAPPLAVDSSTVVGGLNADQLDGLDAQAIADGAVTRSSAELASKTPAIADAAADRAVARVRADQQPAPVLVVAPWSRQGDAGLRDGDYQFSVPTGDYVVSLEGLVRSFTGEAFSYACDVADRLQRDSGDRSAIGAPLLQQAGPVAGGATGSLDQQVHVSLQADRPLAVRCTVQGQVRQVRPVQVVLERVTTQSLASTPVQR